MIAALLIGLVALIHVYIVILEMVWWDTPSRPGAQVQRRH